MESNHPSVGLPRPAGFEGRSDSRSDPALGLGFRAAGAPRGAMGGTVRRLEASFGAFRRRSYLWGGGAGGHPLIAPNVPTAPDIFLASREALYA